MGKVLKNANLNTIVDAEDTPSAFTIKKKVNMDVRLLGGDDGVKSLEEFDENVLVFHTSKTQTSKISDEILESVESKVKNR